MKAGFLGVGNMGLPMAGKILDAGHELVVYDISEDAMRPLLERQARRAASPKEMADTCETVFVSLPTLKVLRDVVLAPGGLIDGKAMKLLVNTCTVGIPMIKEMEAALAARGIGLVDCPISGGPAGAQERRVAAQRSAQREAPRRGWPSLPNPSLPASPPTRRERGASRYSRFAFSLFSRRVGGEAGRRGPG